MKKFIGSIIMIGLIILHSCSDKTEEIEIFEPTVTNLQFYDLSSSSVTLSTLISDDGGSFVNNRGFRLSKVDTNTPSDTWGTDYCCGYGVGEFSETIVGLEENTTYYCVAYASNAIGYGFTTVVSFTTPKKYNSGVIKDAPVVLKKPTLISMEYAATGFETSSDTKYNYKMKFKIEVDVVDYKNISRFGYEIGSQMWYWDNPTENRTFSESMSSLGNSATINVTVSAFAIMKDGTKYAGNVETISGTYTGSTNGGETGGGSTVTNKYADYTSARTYYTGGHSTFFSYETMVSHLNRYGLLIYKNGTSYYWTDLEGIKHSALPDRLYTDQIYDSNIQTGNKENNYQLKRAYIYVSFRFAPF